MLSGDIKVNGTLIGEWYATRASHDRRDFNDYECHLKYRDIQGYPCEAHWFMHGQGHVNGAVSLAARVLSEGMAKAKRVKPDGSI